MKEKESDFHAVVAASFVGETNQIRVNLFFVSIFLNIIFKQINSSFFVLCIQRFDIFYNLIVV